MNPISVNWRDGKVIIEITTVESAIELANAVKAINKGAWLGMKRAIRNAWPLPEPDIEAWLDDPEPRE